MKKKKIIIFIVTTLTLIIILFFKYPHQNSEQILHQNLENNFGKHYYFAYGSNMDIKKMRGRTNNPEIQALSPAYLKNYHLTFPGKVGNVEPALNHTLWGCLYLLEIDDIYDLDQVEGYQEGRENNYYNRELITIQTPNQETYQAFIYIQPRSGGNITSKSYKNTLIQGALDCNLPEGYINTLKDIKTK